MVGKKLFIKGVHCCIYSGGLDQDVIAVGIVLQHSYNAPDLAFNTLQAVDQFLSLRFGT